MVLMENVGDVPLEVTMKPGHWIVDGRFDAFPDGPLMMDGNPYLDINFISFRDTHVAGLGPGQHKIEFSLAGAASNTLVVDVPDR